MLEVYKFSEYELLAFALVLVRLSVFIATWPIFGVETVPAPAKILLALVITMVIFPVVGFKKLTYDLLSQEIIWLTIREAFVGAALGLVCRFFFYAVSVCGEIVSITIGVSTEQLFNPSFGGHVSAVEQIHVMLASLFFLAINGHHVFLSGLIQSFDILPLSVQGLSFGAFSQVGDMAQEIVVAGVKMASPAIATIFFMNVALGITSRAVPQVNILMTSLPVNILLGLFVMVISLPLFVTNMHELLNGMIGRLFSIMKAF